MEDRDKQDILDAISLLAENVQELSEKTDTRFSHIDFEIEGIKSTMSGMVTKSYLDDKLADLKSDLIVLARKSNVKLTALIESLVQNGTLKREIADQILVMEPFAQA